MATKDDFKTIYASDSIAIFSPSVPKLNLGWGITEIPNIQEANWVYNDISSKIKDVKDHNIGDYDEEITYPVNSLMKNGSVGFNIAKQETTGDSSPSSWASSQSRSGKVGQLKYFNLSQEDLQEYLSNGWYIADGSVIGIPDLRKQFIMGTTTRSEIGDLGGNQGGPGLDPTPFITDDVISTVPAGNHNHGSTMLTINLGEDQIPYHFHCLNTIYGTQSATNVPSRVFAFIWSHSQTALNPTSTNSNTFPYIYTTGIKGFDNQVKSVGQAHGHDSAEIGESGEHSHDDVIDAGGWDNMDVDYSSFQVIILIYRPDL